jgi:LPS sulfotransferase NodH
VAEPDHGTRITRSYLVCTTPRSGSTLLCQHLRRTDRAGFPFELWLVKSETARWAEIGATTFAEYFADFTARTVTANGVIGAKVMWGQLAHGLDRLRDAGFASGGDRDAAVLAAAFPDLRYVWLRREDVDRQGVSWWRATATRQYHVTDEGNRAPAPPFDFDGIDRRVRQLRAMDEQWGAWFTAGGIAPVVVTYEEFVAHRERVLRGVLQSLGITMPIGFRFRRGRLVRASRFRRLADATTDAYVAQYRREAQSRA